MCYWPIQRLTGERDAYKRRLCKGRTRREIRTCGRSSGRVTMETMWTFMERLTGELAQAEPGT